MFRENRHHQSEKQASIRFDDYEQLTSHQMARLKYYYKAPNAWDLEAFTPRIKSWKHQTKNKKQQKL